MSSFHLSAEIVTFVSLVFPPVLGYFIIAMLAVTPQTRTLRLALWPIIALFSLRATLSVDMSPGEFDRKFHNMLFVFSMILIATRTFEWVSVKGPLVRHMRPARSSKSRFLDALDLATTLRGYGWDWSHGVHFPPDTRPACRRGFIFHVVLSTVFHAFLCGALQIVLVSFSPTGFGSLEGGSIFDNTLPLYLGYTRASLITAIAALAIYAPTQTYYDAWTLVGVLVLGQDPAQWPPAFDAPWRATSLIDFWGRRWHQFFRRTFVVLGGYPLHVLLGEAGFVVGTFLSSGVLHQNAMISLNARADPLRMLVGFGMMGPLILVERAFKRITGRRVGGVAGWIWTWVWLLLSGMMIVDAFARAGVFAHYSFTEDMVPGRAIVQRLVASFDAWLHGQ